MTPAKTVTPAQLGRRIKQARLKQGLSQEDVAGPDYTAAYISHVEHGKRRPSQEALTHFASRLGMTVDQLVSGRDPDDDMRLEAETQRAIASIHLGHAEDALDELRSLRDEAFKVDHARAFETAELGIAVALQRLGLQDEAQGVYERVLELNTDASPEQRTTALVGKARCLFHSDEARDGVYLLENHLHELQRSPHPDPGCLVETYAALIPGYFETGHIDRATEAAAKGWKLASQTPDPESRACLYVNRALLLTTQGEHRQALASLALAEDLYRHLGWYAEAAKIAFSKAYSLSEQEDWAAAEKLLRTTLAEPGATVTKADRIRMSTLLALVVRKQGNPEEGLALAQEARKAAGSAFAGLSAEAEREIGLCLSDLGELDTALSHWRRALKAFVRSDDHEEAAKTARLIGDALSDQGDERGAIEAYRQGLSSVEQLRC